AALIFSRSMMTFGLPNCLPSRFAPSATTNWTSVARNDVRCISPSIQAGSSMQTPHLISPSWQYSRVQRISAASLRDWSWLPLDATPGKSDPGEYLTIIQHPNGERKQVCVRENKFLKYEGDAMWYATDTLGGSHSGGLKP